ncbi:Cytochrome P450 704C1 [Apostasia shenzhenica]|uniref:noroxomaritidine synthase n=1 Tax=Apostasia shenzhenica TaxID=1088818 RepID=A0A2I0BDT4_9ASPA|nr:Cytochrome P450 704C1 [Apostasia shenzhenica]
MTEDFTATALFFPIPNPNRHPAPSLPTSYPAPSRHPSPTPPSTRASSLAALPGPLAPSLSDAAFNRSVLARGVCLCNLACLPISSGWFHREIEDRRWLIKVQCVVAFGAKQFPEKERKKTWSFFNWYYFALISILLLAVGVHVHTGNHATLGFRLTPILPGWCFGYHTNLARKNKTFRLIKPSHSEIYTNDPANVEHFMKSNFSNYTRGEFNRNVMKDLFGDGLFSVDGEKWRHQKKLASYEFSTKVLRDFSSIDLFMKVTLDSIFKVGFGFDLDTLSGSNEFAASFSRAFDDSNHIVFSRFSDIFWEAKRYFNIGKEKQLKRNLKVIDEFAFRLISRKREKMNTSTEEMLTSNLTEDCVDDFFFPENKGGYTEKIVAEIEDLSASQNRDDSSIDEFMLNLSEEVLDSMHHLHATLTETLRLFPAVPVGGKFAEEDDVLSDGFKVKKGDGVNHLTYTMGRMAFISAACRNSFYLLNKSNISFL